MPETEIRYFARLELTPENEDTRIAAANPPETGASISDLIEGGGLQYRVQNNALTPLTVWDALTDPYTDFRALWLEADGELEIELTCDQAGGDQRFVFVLAANAPFVLFSNFSRHTPVGGDLLAGTAGVINRIRAVERNNLPVNLVRVLGR